METEKPVEPKKHQTPRFIHFGWYGQTMCPGKKKHNGVLTIAYRQTDSALRVGFVFCSPSDNFSRKEGRNEALKFMRNLPIVMPLDKCKSNREVILGLVNYLCGIGPKGIDWDVPNAAVENYHKQDSIIVVTSRIPGWAKKWWLNIVVNGAPMGRHQTPMKYEGTGDPWESVEYVGSAEFKYTKQNLFDITVREFFKQAKQAGIAADIMLG